MRVRDGRAEVTHGSRVETTSWFFTDGIWAGAFGEGRFDQSFFCGTGVIDSRSGLTIVSASTPLDRVFTTTMGPELFASNSLPFFLAMIDDSLDEDWLFYRSQFIAAKTGFRIARRQFSTRRGRRVRVVTGETAVVGQGGELIPRLRPLDSDFADFGHYRSTLAATVAALVANSRCLERRLPLEPLVSLSAGYDSTAVAVLVSEAGGKHAATMLRYGEDGELVDHPGMATARLGLRLKEFERDTWRDRTDLPDAEIAAAGTEFIDIPFLALEEELPGKVLFVGYPGDNVWGRHNFRCYRDIVQTDTCGQGLAEYRLRVGFVLCPVAYIGATAHPSLYRITTSPEMAPWSVGGHYDRPIARRIIEEAGIDRGSFAVRKYAGSALVYSNTRRYRSSDESAMRAEMSEFMTKAGAASFVSFCLDGRLHRHRAKMRAVTGASRVYHKLDALNWRIGRRLHRRGIKSLFPRRIMARIASRSVVHADYTYLFPHWGTEVTKAAYASVAPQFWVGVDPASRHDGK